MENMKDDVTSHCVGEHNDDDDDDDGDLDKEHADNKTSNSQGCIPVGRVKDKGRKPGSVSAIPDEQYNFIIGILEGKIQLSTLPKSERTKAQKAAIIRVWRNKGILQVAKVHNPVTGKKEKRLISRKDERIILRESERAMVTQKYHQNYKGNGARRLFGVLRNSFIGCSRQSIQSDLKKFKQTEHHKVEPVLDGSGPPPLENAKVPQERHQIDLITLEAIPAKHRGRTYKYVLTVQDSFSRFLWLRPVSSKDGAEVAEHLMSLYNEYGPPQEILWDHGAEINLAVKQVCADLKIELINGSGVVHRQGLERTEHSRKLWKAFDLYHFAKRTPNWVAKLPGYQLAQNEAKHHSLGMTSPFKVYFGRTSNSALNRLCFRETVDMKLNHEITDEESAPIPQSCATPSHSFANHHFLETILQRISSKNSSDFRALQAFINTHLKLLTSSDSADTMRDDLIAHAMELGYFERGETPKDGNCLFHVLVDQLSRARANNRLDHRRLRQQLVDHLRQNPTTSDGEHLQSFMYGITWKEYLSKMEDDEWGDQFILQAFANVYQATIHVISSLGEAYNYIVSPTVGKPKEQELLLGHIFERHYISLEPLETSSPSMTPVSGHHPAPNNTSDTNVVVQQVETNYEDVLKYFEKEQKGQRRVGGVTADTTPTAGFTHLCTRGPRGRFFIDFMSESGRQYPTHGTFALVPQEDMQIYDGIDEVIQQSLSDDDWIEEICPPFIYWVTRVRSWTQPVQRLSANVAVLLRSECDQYRAWCENVKCNTQQMVVQQ